MAPSHALARSKKPWRQRDTHTLATPSKPPGAIMNRQDIIAECLSLPANNRDRQAIEKLARKATTQALEDAVLTWQIMPSFEYEMDKFRRECIAFEPMLGDDEFQRTGGLV